VGLVSTGLITAGSEAADYLKALSFECVIVDEAHRARRRNLGEDRDGEKLEPNNRLPRNNTPSTSSTSGSKRSTGNLANMSSRPGRSGKR
jgi:hypothetical protein